MFLMISNKFPFNLCIILYRIFVPTNGVTSNNWRKNRARQQQFPFSERSIHLCHTPSVGPRCFESINFAQMIRKCNVRRKSLLMNAYTHIAPTVLLIMSLNLLSLWRLRIFFTTSTLPCFSVWIFFDEIRPGTSRKQHTKRQYAHIKCDSIKIDIKTFRHILTFSSSAYLIRQKTRHVLIAFELNCVAWIEVIWISRVFFIALFSIRILLWFW